MQIAELTFTLEEAAQQVGLPGADEISSADAGFGGFLSQILSAVFAIAFLLVFLNLIIGAIQWITAGGDKSKIEQSRNKMTQSVIGVLVLSSVVVIIMILQDFLGFQLFNFTGKALNNAETPATGVLRNGMDATKRNIDVPQKAGSGNSDTNNFVIPGMNDSK